jgi:hypothetical protein
MAFSITLKDLPPGVRGPALVLLLVFGTGAGAIGGYVMFETRLETKVEGAAEAAVQRKWTEAYQEQALKACTVAADQGAYRAVSEAMQQTVLPMQRMLDKHIAAQEERDLGYERRFARLERKP